MKVKHVLMIAVVLLAMLVMPVVAEETPITQDTTDKRGQLAVTDSLNQKYIVTIPDSVQFNQEAKIAASEVTLNDGAALKVTVSSDGEWALVHQNQKDKHPYGMYIKGESTPVADGNSVLSMAYPSESAFVVLTFAKEGELKKAGTWTDVLTFSVAVDEIGATTVTKVYVSSAEGINFALDEKMDIIMTEDMTISSTDTPNSGYGAAGVKVDGVTFDGNGQTLTVNDAWGTWDCAVNPMSGTIKNLVINSGMRGIFMGDANGDVYVDNVTIDGTVYTFNSDAGNKNYGVYISNSTLNGWTSFSDAHKEVIFTNCNFGEGAGYAFCRPYNACEFIGCTFEEGFEFDTGATRSITFTNCKYGDVKITADNAATLGIDETKFFGNFVENSAYSTILDGITINEVVAKDSPSSD